MGNGALTDRIASRSGASSVTSLTYSTRRPRKEATRSTWLPTVTGGGVSSRTPRTPPSTPGRWPGRAGRPGRPASGATTPAGAPAPRAAAGGPGHLRGRASQPRAPEPLQLRPHLRQPLQVHAVQPLVAVDAHVHQAGLAEHLEVLRGCRARYPDPLGDAGGGLLGVPHQLQHRAARGMGEGAEGLVDLRHELRLSAIKG